MQLGGGALYVLFGAISLAFIEIDTTKFNKLSTQTLAHTSQGACPPSVSVSSKALEYSEVDM